MNRPATTPGADRVTTIEVGPGGLGAYIDRVPRPPGRISYRDGSLTLVSPSYNHERGVDRLDDLVKAIGDDLEIPYNAAASTLYRRDDLDRGLTPDKSYYIEHQGALEGVEKTVDLRLYPPPDLVIEVVWTHKATESLEICRALEIPEAWLYDIPSGDLQFLHLDPSGSYVLEAQSRAFPFLFSADALAMIESGPAGESGHLWKRRLRAWVREELGPRRPGP